MHRHVSLLLLLFLIVCGPAGEARQQQIKGQVVNRDGVPQQCQVDFYIGSNSNPVWRLTSDKQGYFYINNPRDGGYRVVVVQGSQQDEFKRVSIDQYGLHPATLVVRW